MPAGHIGYRADIDGLRAVSVLAVVGFHAFPSLIPGGFIGVDIFFVISGFLISSIIFTTVENGQLSFVDFYTRRINRIFPALIIVILASYLIGWIALLPDEFEQLGKHIAGATAFISNFILWSEVDYFDQAAESKPLLHLWSLSVEEQFYIIWPLLVFLIWRKKRTFLIILISIGVTSFLFNVFALRRDPALAFYSPAARFWELMIGGALAYLSLKSTTAINSFNNNLISALGVLLLGIGIATIDKERAFPGWLALLPTLGAALLIAATQKSWINSQILSNGAAVWFGKISYPLYLWHWPLLSFAAIMEQGTPSVTIRIAAVLISVILAWLTYRVVEMPIRFGGNGSFKAVCAAAALIAIGTVGFMTLQAEGIKTRSHVAHFVTNAKHWRKEVRQSYVSDCPSGLEQYVECFLFPDAQDADVIMIGDSHADHLIPGLAHHKPSNLKVGALLLNGGCPPLFGVERLRQGVPMENYGRKGARCSEINTARLGYILKSRAKTVLISLTALDYNNNKRPYEGGQNPKYAYQDVPGGSHDVFSLALNETVKKFVDAGKDVILVYDNPSFKIDKLAACLQPGRPLHLPGSVEPISCEVPRIAAEKEQDAVDALYQKLSQEFPSQVKVFDSLKYLCIRETCPMRQEGVLLYRDQNHLSYEGSLRLMKSFFEEFDLKLTHSNS
jgi:peptidoglycan/LPS O-acetylase OafA/YrhL